VSRDILPIYRDDVLEADTDRRSVHESIASFGPHAARGLRHMHETHIESLASDRDVALAVQLVATSRECRWQTIANGQSGVRSTLHRPRFHDCVRDIASRLEISDPPY
jgi:hypothetical protein